MVRVTIGRLRDYCRNQPSVGSDYAPTFVSPGPLLRVSTVGAVCATALINQKRNCLSSLRNPSPWASKSSSQITIDNSLCVITEPHEMTEVMKSDIEIGPV